MKHILMILIIIVCGSLKPYKIVKCDSKIVNRYYLKGKLVYNQVFDSVMTQTSSCHYPEQYNVKGKVFYADSMVTTLK